MDLKRLYYNAWFKSPKKIRNKPINYASPLQLNCVLIRCKEINECWNDGILNLEYYTKTICPLLEREKKGIKVISIKPIKRLVLSELEISVLKYILDNTNYPNFENVISKIRNKLSLLE